MDTLTHQPDIIMLRREVEKRFGQPLNTSNDFGRLSSALSEAGAGYLSQSTLKRLWGYVKDTHSKHRSTLDILARYVGQPDFATYCQSVSSHLLSDSGFADGQVLDAASLAPGDTVEVRWNPDRVLILKALGELIFEVTEGRNTRIGAGQKVRCMSFVSGQPLLLDLCSDTDGQKMVYIAGKQGGIVWSV